MADSKDALSGTLTNTSDTTDGLIRKGEGRHFFRVYISGDSARQTEAPMSPLP